MKIKCLFLSISILLAGCATTQTLVPVEKASNTKALVYFLRKSYPPYIRELRVVIDGVTTATIANNDYVAVNVPVGKSDVILEATDGKNLAFELSVEKPGTLYFLLTGEVAKTGQDISSIYPVVSTTVYLEWRLWATPISRDKAKLIANEFGKQLE
jgi:hypothetical protein